MYNPNYNNIKPGHLKWWVTVDQVPEKVFKDVEKLTGKFKIEDWTAKDDDALKTQILKFKSSKQITHWLPAAFYELKLTNPRLWNKFWYLNRGYLLILELMLNDQAKTVNASECLVKKSKMTPELKTFFARTCIQGSPETQTVISLVQGSAVVAALAFKKLTENGGYELLAYGSSLRIQGLVPKLKEALLKLTDAKYIISFSVNSTSTGSLQKALGFTKLKDVGPETKVWYGPNLVGSKTGDYEVGLPSFVDAGKTKWKLEF